MKFICILKTYFLDDKPTSKMENRVLVEKIDFLGGVGA